VLCSAHPDQRSEDPEILEFRIIKCTYLLMYTYLSIRILRERERERGVTSTQRENERMGDIVKSPRFCMHFAL